MPEVPLTHMLYGAETIEASVDRWEPLPEDEPPKPVDPTPPEAEEEPPKRKRGRPPGSKTKTTTKTLHSELGELVALPALAFQLKGDDYCAYVWTVRAGPFASSVADLAEKNPALKRWLLKMMQGGAYSAVIWTGLSLLVPILAYYGMYPSGLINPFELNPGERAEYEAMMNARNGGAMFGGDASVPHPVS